MAIVVDGSGQSYVFWKVLGAFKRLCVDPALEVKGLDSPEMAPTVTVATNIISQVRLAHQRVRPTGPVRWQCDWLVDRLI